MTSPYIPAPPTTGAVHLVPARSERAHRPLRRAWTLVQSKGFFLRAMAPEVVGVAAAVVLGLVVLAHLAASPRAWVLFYDGDSLLFPLAHASLAAGQAQHWVLSSPLFLPEAVVYLGIAAIGLPVKATLLVNGLVNWVALYAAIRFLATLIRVRRRTAIRSAVAAVALFSAAALCESSASHDAVEPASLMATTTYYSGTVIAAVVTTALLARALQTPTAGRLAGLGTLVAFAVLSNPLFIGWAVVPGVAVAVLTLTCGTRPRTLLLTVASSMVGTAIGLTARIPFGGLLVQDDAAKIRPDLAATSAQYYAALLQIRLGTALGRLELALLLGLIALAAATLILAIRHRWITGTVIAGTALLTPLLVTAGAITLGTFAARYLQPVVFTAVLGVLPLPLLLRQPQARRLQSNPKLVTVAGAGTLGSVLIALSVSVLVQAGGTTSPSLVCVKAWVATHQGVGAGQYWTIRAPKAYATTDPNQLLQIDSTGSSYAWLDNTADYQQHPRYSFTITDAASTPFSGPLATARAHTTQCGSYTISDYSPRTFSAGALRH